MKTRSDWLADIENTKLEIEAYQMIAEGFKILSRMPEHNTIDRLKYTNKAMQYKTLQLQVSDFLTELYSYENLIGEQDE